MTSEEVYNLAYDYQYKKRDYVKAYALYMEVINRFPVSFEQKTSEMQLRLIEKTIDIEKLVSTFLTQGQLEEPGSHPIDNDAVAEMVEQIQIAKRKEQELKEATAIFQNAKNIDNLIVINSELKKWAIPLVRDNKIVDYGKLYDYSDLLDFELVENGDSISKGSRLSAALGAVGFGITGAIIGAAGTRTTTKNTVYDLHIVVFLKNDDESKRIIRIINEDIYKNSDNYTEAVNRCEEIMALLKQILNSNNEKNVPAKKVEARAIYAFSVADEIMKFKNLMDAGIITEEEFIEQKKKLLLLDY